MLKQIAAISVVIALSAAPAAHAAPNLDTAYRAMIQAGQALGEAREAYQSGAAGLDGLLAELERFGAAAQTASQAMDAHDGPADLRCIYRGMAADAADQRDRLARGEADAALETLAYLAEDAVLVTPEAAAEEDDPYAALGGEMTCPAAF